MDDEPPPSGLVVLAVVAASLLGWALLMLATGWVLGWWTR